MPIRAIRKLNQRTSDQTTDTDGGGEGSAAVVGAVEPSGLSASGYLHEVVYGLLLAHVVHGALLVEAASVVDGNILAHLGVVSAVAVLDDLLLDAHCE